jgi:hypothetical protein
VQEKRIFDPHFTHFGSFSIPLPLLSGILPHHMVADDEDPKRTEADFHEWRDQARLGPISSGDALLSASAM